MTWIYIPMSATIPWTGQIPPGFALIIMRTGHAGLLMMQGMKVSKLKKILNKFDKAVNALSDKSKYTAYAKDGSVIGTFTGKEVKDVWNGTSFHVVSNSTDFHNGGGGGGTGGAYSGGFFGFGAKFHGESQLTSRVVMGWEGAARRDNDSEGTGVSSIIFHELSHELPIGQQIIQNNGGVNLTDGPGFDTRERETQTVGGAAATAVGAPFECKTSNLGCQ